MSDQRDAPLWLALELSETANIGPKMAEDWANDIVRRLDEERESGE